MFGKVPVNFKPGHSGVYRGPRRTLTIWVLMLIAACSARAQAPGPPNFLILFSDDQRADAVGAHGNPYIQTPSLDALAERGFSFRQAYVMGSHHGAVCAPSRAMLMTGRNLFRVYDNLDSLETFPQRLQQVGYQTFGTGKWHQSRESFAKSFAEGRSIFFGGMNDHFRTHMSDRLDDGTFTDSVPRDFSTTRFADAAIDFLTGYASSERDAPFLAYVAFTAPHDPRSPPGDYMHVYRGEGMPLPPNFMPLHPFDLGPMSMAVRDEHLAPWPRPTDVIRSQIAEYYGLITHMDAEIGRIFKTLLDTGLEDNTIVVFAADNGLGLGSHGTMGKQSLYEHSTRVPLIVAGPGIPQGESNALSYLYDLTPTILRLAGATDLPRMDGLDLAPIWGGEPTELRESLFTAFHDTQRSVRDSRWKLIRYPRIHHTQLFDLKRDPYELNNLAGDPDQRHRLRNMMILLEEWQRKMGDPHPLTAADRSSMEFDYDSIERRPDQWQPAWIREKYFSDTDTSRSRPEQVADGVQAYRELFDSRMRPGVACYRIPSLATAPNGDLVAAIDERVPSCEDLGSNRDINIVVRRSTDNGESWTGIETLVDFPDGQSASDPSIVVDRTTEQIFLFFNFMDLDAEPGTYYLHVVRSSDNGLTWSAPEDITSQISKTDWTTDFKFITSGRGIQTSTGMLLHTVVNLDKGLHLFGSTDHGRTWFLFDTPLRPANESKIVELSDGSWLVNSRVSEGGTRYVHVSGDGGQTWESRPDPELPDPGCNASIVRYSEVDADGQSGLLFSNAADPSERRNLTVRLSYDGGVTWAAGRSVYTGPSAYSSMTVMKNGEIGLLFEKDRYTQNVFVRLTLEWLTKGSAPPD